jgi:acyl-CoA synthetase (AMP-forming)/AMP-acid ligase II
MGAVFAPLNARYGVEEAEDVVRLARARVLVADPAHIEAAETVAERIGGLPVALLDEAGKGAAARQRVFDLSAAARAASADEPELPEVDERDTHVIFFTSGSTGKPKGVVLSHRVNYLRSFAGNFGNAERIVCMFPLFHMAGWTQALGAWQTGGEIIFVDAPTADTLLGAVERRRATRLYCIPAVWARILETDFSRRDLSSLREVDTGTSATPPELVAALKERFPGTVTRIVYGSTEAGSGARLADADVLRKPGSVGPAAAGVDLKLGAGGEVCLRSDFMMDGYFDNAEATAEALQGGWYHTGDVGVLDDEGYLSIVGRVRDIIRTGGETVGPGEVEEVLASFPGLVDVAVVGVPDARWGEIICAAVVPGEGGAPTLEDLTRHCEGRLAKFKHPRRIEIVEEVPRTPATRQVRRALILERILIQPSEGG